MISNSETEKNLKSDIKKLLPKQFAVDVVCDDVWINVKLNSKITFEKANEHIFRICKDLHLKEMGCGTNLESRVRDWHLKCIPQNNVNKTKEKIKKSNKSVKDMIAKLVVGKQNGDLFCEVRQRVAAYKYYREFWKKNDVPKDIQDDDYLDEAYRFLYSTVDPNFILFCAEKEKMEPLSYLRMLLGPTDCIHIIETGDKDPTSAFLDNLLDLKDKLSKLYAAVSGALPYLVLYDGGKYDTKESLIKAIYAAREILCAGDPEHNKHVHEMFKNWKKIYDSGKETK